MPLVSLESARPLRDFDVVGFSLQFELTYTNILDDARSRRASRCASSDRGEDDPLVIAGGPTATHPEPHRAVHRRDRDRRRRGARDRDRALVDRRSSARACRAPSACVALAQLARRLRAVALRDARSIRTPASRSSTGAARAGRRRFPVERALVDDLNEFPVPRRRPRRRSRGDLRSHVDRDRARLHRGLPLLPGRHDLPAGARARSGGDRRHRAARA